MCPPTAFHVDIIDNNIKRLLVLVAKRRDFGHGASPGGRAYYIQQAIREGFVENKGYYPKTGQMKFKLTPCGRRVAKYLLDRQNQTNHQLIDADYNSGTCPLEQATEQASEEPDFDITNMGYHDYEHWDEKRRNPQPSPYRRNSDEETRELQRLWAQGDQEAGIRLKRIMERIQPVSFPWRGQLSSSVTVYIMSGEIFCEDCGEAIRKEIHAEDPDECHIRCVDCNYLGPVEELDLDNANWILCPQCGRHSASFDIQDSEGFPQIWQGSDEATDSPSHCGVHEGCLNAFQIGWDIGGVPDMVSGFINFDLTDEGVNYVVEAIEEQAEKDTPSKLIELWAYFYSNYEEIEEAARRAGFPDPEKLRRNPEPSLAVTLFKRISNLGDLEKRSSLIGLRYLDLPLVEGLALTPSELVAATLNRPLSEIHKEITDYRTDFKQENLQLNNIRKFIRAHYDTSLAEALIPTIVIEFGNLPVKLFLEAISAEGLDPKKWEKEVELAALYAGLSIKDGIMSFPGANSSHDPVQEMTADMIVKVLKKRPMTKDFLIQDMLSFGIDSDFVKKTINGLLRDGTLIQRKNGKLKIVPKWKRKLKQKRPL
jgi:hypothetical protein